MTLLERSQRDSLKLFSQRDDAGAGDHDLLNDLYVLPFPASNLYKLVLEPAAVQSRLIGNPTRMRGTPMNPPVLVEPSEKFCWPDAEDLGGSCDANVALRFGKPVERINLRGLLGNDLLKLKVLLGLFSSKPQSFG